MLTYDEAVANIDSAITVYQRRNKCNQADVASKLAMTEVTLSYKRRGINEWKLNELIAVAMLTGVDAGLLVGGE